MVVCSEPAALAGASEPESDRIIPGIFNWVSVPGADGQFDQPKPDELTRHVRLWKQGRM